MYRSFRTVRILFVSGSECDYLADGILRGLLELHGGSVTDWPRCDRLYPDFPAASRGRIRGGGFTLYTSPVQPGPIDRYGIEQSLGAGAFDLVIIGNIWRSWGIFHQWRVWLNPANCIILDGEDTPQVYPYAGLWWRRMSRWSVPRAHRGYLYFKREWTGESQFNLWHRAVPQRLRKYLPPYGGLRRIAFALPSDKLFTGEAIKRKTFGRHIVDEEVARSIPDSSTKYAFGTEDEYYADLRASRFGVTTKRAGWDCLRHYEIAANGCVPCFRNLADKPATCAPHGLGIGRNCLSYTSADDLARQVAAITPEYYAELQANARAWAQANTCRARAAELMQEWAAFCTRHGGRALST